MSYPSSLQQLGTSSTALQPVRQMYYTGNHGNDALRQKLVRAQDFVRTMGEQVTAAMGQMQQQIAQERQIAEDRVSQITMRCSNAAAFLGSQMRTSNSCIEELTVALVSFRSLGEDLQAKYTQVVAERAQELGQKAPIRASTVGTSGEITRGHHGFRHRESRIAGKAMRERDDGIERVAHGRSTHSIRFRRHHRADDRHDGSNL